MVTHSNEDKKESVTRVVIQLGFLASQAASASTSQKGQFGDVYNIIYGLTFYSGNHSLL